MDDKTSETSERAAHDAAAMLDRPAIRDLITLADQQTEADGAAVRPATG
jgi:hypothetical protein